MILIISTVVSLFIEYLKSKTELGGFKTLAILLLVSIIAAEFYTLLVDAGLWDTVAQVLVTAGAFYAFIIRSFNQK